MAVTLMFVRGAGTTLSLQNALSGLQLANDGWTPKIATPTVAPAGPVVETLQIIAQAASQDALAALLQELHAMQMWANRYWSDRDEQQPVWLYVKMHSESNTRRALVHRIDAVFGTGWFDPETITNAVDITLTVEREPYWEAVDADWYNYAYNYQPFQSMLAYPEDYTANVAPGPDHATEIAQDVPGDVPARIERLWIITDPGAVPATNYSEFWVGFRSANKHPDTNYSPPRPGAIPQIEAESGTPQTADTTEIAEGTASGSGNNAVRVTFASGAGWLERQRITLSSLANTEFGSYLLLLRAGNDNAATVCEVQVRAGYPGATTVYSEIVQVTTATWAIHNLGLMTLPFRDYRTGTANDYAAYIDNTTQIEIWARRLSGTANLILDCILCVPADELLLHVTDTPAGELPGNLAVFSVVGQAPEGHFSAISRTAIRTWPYVHASGQASASGIGIPPGDGRVYLVGAHADHTHAIIDTAHVAIEAFARYLSLRGAA